MMSFIPDIQKVGSGADEKDVVNVTCPTYAFDECGMPLNVSK
jgi:hypothetical protein